MPSLHPRVVLVEGESDRVAVLAVAARHGRDLEAEAITVEPIGGAQAIGRFLATLEPGVEIAGLCDAGEARAFARALERAGLGVDLGRVEMERLGFYVCDADLEDELIRALGADGVEAVLDGEGDLRSFRTFQKQPAQQARPREAQLRRFMGTRSGRKSRYAHLLVDALDLARVPRPLARLLAYL